MTSIPIRRQEFSNTRMASSGAGIQKECSSREQDMAHLNIQNHNQSQQAAAASSRPQACASKHKSSMLNHQDLQNDDPSTTHPSSIDIDLAIQAIEPEYRINHQQARDMVYQARMSLMAMREDDPEYKTLLREQRALLRGANSWNAGVVEGQGG
ncbi:hypothetical protein M409DRAFT_52167 [Zasmidium cellare ATCC 36951]|uniref:Uncharacterized protein n=1 Tax=Zasmidium cellare ATCC 36951 TaxID=1080233 RepID=A0A6A6CTY8_ZASCE|nr:uncharacterized protein M409DRAFT_52167 [Zasmidium cellare ATCC 36951]KAF2169648.1 hypothetical protein M409DRAFT_52167 [Zasmidium cellare ATCC 36951]